MGSSRISRSGRATSSAASATRIRQPPDSSLTGRAWSSSSKPRPASTRWASAVERVAAELLEAGLGLTVGGEQLVVVGVVDVGQAVGEVLEAVGDAGDVPGAGERLVEDGPLLGGVQVLGQVADAQALRAVHLALVGLLHADEDLDQRGLAEPVAADERLAATREEAQGHVAEQQPRARTTSTGRTR